MTSVRSPEENAALFEPEDGELRLRFTTQRAAYQFKLWLCESGEQDYWDWMSIREAEEDGPITATRFDYHNQGVIAASCGRLDVDDDEDEDGPAN